MAGFDDAYDRKMMRQAQNHDIYTDGKEVYSNINKLDLSNKDRILDDNTIDDKTKECYYNNVICDTQEKEYRKNHVTDFVLNWDWFMPAGLNKGTPGSVRRPIKVSDIRKIPDLVEYSNQTNGYIISWHKNNKIEYDFVPDGNLPPHENKSRIKSYVENICPEGSKFARAYSDNGKIKGIEHAGLLYLLESKNYIDNRGFSRTFLNNLNDSKNKEITTNKTIDYSISSDLYKSRKSQEGYFIIWENGDCYDYDFQLLSKLTSDDKSNIAYLQKQYPDGALINKGYYKDNGVNLPDYQIYKDNNSDIKDIDKLEKLAFFCRKLQIAIRKSYTKIVPNNYKFKKLSNSSD